MKSYHHTKKPARLDRAFTLVELLVVISIIAALASLSFVAARAALMKSDAAKTTSNLRQIYTAVIVIQEDGIENGWNRRGTFPPYAGHIIDDSGWRPFNIYELIGEQIGACEVDGSGYKWKNHPKDTILQNPLSKHKFAGDVKEASDISNRSFGLGGFCYNAHIEGWVGPQSAESSVKLTRMSGFNNQGIELADASRTILMGEMNDNGGKIFTGWGGTGAPNGRYKKGAHCVFIDGHVEHLNNNFLASEEGWHTHMRLQSKY